MHLRLSCCLLLLAFVWLRPVSAQDETPAPEFLYRDENRLVLVNAYTGETTELPIEVTGRDRFAWSPDGQYLLTRLYDDNDNSYCLNLYTVDAQEWLYEEPISCTVEDALFSRDSAHIVYISSGGTNEVVWLYTIENETNKELYQTPDETEINQIGLSELQASPTGAYITFIIYQWIMGGTINDLVVMNIDSGNYSVVRAPDNYYASYRPIWSADDRWFLIMLKEEYVTSGTLPATNHRGDVYLVSSEAGEQYRLTYTPAAPEEDIHWAENGAIVFTTVIRQEKVFTLEEAMSVEVVPPENMIEPEEIDTDNFYNPLVGVMISPDPDYGTWVSPIPIPETGNYELNIGYISSRSPVTRFTTDIPEYYQSDYILIGWRPSDYPIG